MRRSRPAPPLFGWNDAMCRNKQKRLMPSLPDGAPVLRGKISRW